jgi:hypothetical protein
MDPAAVGSVAAAHRYSRHHVLTCRTSSDAD